MLVTVTVSKDNFKTFQPKGEVDSWKKFRWPLKYYENSDS